MQYMRDFAAKLQETGEFVDSQALSAEGTFVRYDGPGRPPVTDEPSETLLRELIPSVLGVLVRRGADFATAEDAVQKALVAALRDWADTLELYFRCAHPSLTPSSAVALTLRAAGGPAQPRRRGRSGGWRACRPRGIRGCRPGRAPVHGSSSLPARAGRRPGRGSAAELYVERDHLTRQAARLRYGG